MTAIEVFAPEEGGNSYDGLDAKNRFRLDPGLGSIDDFRNLVRLAHSFGMHVITFQNLGYGSLDSDQFLKAADDERAGRASIETGFYYWSEHADAPVPAASNSYFFVRPSLPGYNPTKNEFWQWSDRARKYYWTRWPGVDAQGNPIHLPQYNWTGDAWPGEAAHIIRFWLSTGIDGMVLDAVNWYAGMDWQKNAEFFRIHSRESFLSPKAEEPSTRTIRWDGSQKGLHQSVRLWAGNLVGAGNNPLEQAVRDAKPQLLEQALRNYHDPVVAAGGTLYFPVPNLKDPELQTFTEALLVGSGDMLCYCAVADSITRPAAGVPKLLQFKSTHPALFQNSTRRRIPTSEDDRIYAILRESADHAERLLLVFNFSALPTQVQVDTGAIRAARYVDIESHTESNVALAALAWHCPRMATASSSLVT